MNIRITLATESLIDSVAFLFDLYRQFYGKESDLNGAKVFLRERLNSKQSVVLIAISDEKIVGFTQMYPCFSSLSLKPQFILNDLFVIEEFRKKGVARKLMRKAVEFAQSKPNCKGLTLKTAEDNFSAQKLYESENWVKETGFLTYDFELI